MGAIGPRVAEVVANGGIIISSINYSLEQRSRRMSVRRPRAERCTKDSRVKKALRRAWGKKRKILGRATIDYQQWTVTGAGDKTLVKAKAHGKLSLPRHISSLGWSRETQHTNTVQTLNRQLAACTDSHTKHLDCSISSLRTTNHKSSRQIFRLPSPDFGSPGLPDSFTGRLPDKHIHVACCSQRS